MSVHEVRLPSPPPDFNLRGPMPALFSKTTIENLNSDGLSDQIGSDTDNVARKKVGFHPWTTNILEPQLSTPDSEVPPSLKSLPPSRDCQLSSRPILKPMLSLESVLGLDGRTERKSSLDDMESLLRHLADNDRSSSIDAYQSITSLIKMYDDPPEQEVLQNKMGQLQNFIRRDLVVLDVDADSLPSEERLCLGNLVMSALKVLVTMVWSPTYSPCLTDEFKTWTIERAIRVLKEHSASKATLLHYMHLLATQNFQSTTITNANRVPRILEVLNGLTDHISGKAVVAERLLVYQRLIEQAKSTMKAKADLWVKNLFTAMSHSFKEVRSNAISAGTKACAAFLGPASIAAAARAALAEVTNERTLSASTTNRLERVLAAKDEAIQIPQIWTIVLILCNAGQHKLDSWAQSVDWLKLIQRCFNCSDPTVKEQAFIAWNRLYFIARPHEASDKVVSMLAKPAFTQLDKTGSNQSSKVTRQAVVSSYCMLLYYAFRPSATPAQYTRMWNEFVVKLMTRSFLSKSTANCDLSCRVLSALFHGSPSASRVWNENRAHASAPLDPHELPVIDCKWTRSKTSSILSIFRLLVDYSTFGPNETLSERSYVAQTWSSLTNAIRESSSKEVVPSAETKAALSGLLDFLRPVDEQDTIAERYMAKLERLKLLAKVAVATLGVPAMLQALDATSEHSNVFVVKEVMLTLCRPESELSSETTQQFFVRCLFHVKAELNFAHNQTPATLSNHAVTKVYILDAMLHVLQQIQIRDALSTLLMVQIAIVTLVQDADAEFQSNDSSSELVKVYHQFCSSIVQLLSYVDLADYAKLDELLASIVSMTEPSTANRLLEVWRNQGWGHNEHSYGPKLQEAMMNQSRSDVHLPGVFQIDTRQGFGLASTDASDQITGAGGKSHRASLRKQGRQGHKSKRRHDDSQVEFVSIESSPPDYEIFESQLLTTRQKEVRARQNTEPVLTFADIRSSPSTGKKRSRVPEAKHNTVDTPERPATPTLPQQREDNDQPPTPTPKTRRALRSHLQPEITSSPPSVVNVEAHTRTSGAITSSPVKDPVDADDAIQLGALDGPDQVTPTSKPHLVLDARGNAHVAVVQLPQKAPVFEQRPVESSRGQYQTAEADDATAYSDEFDALAASQLSQNLVEQSQVVPEQVEMSDSPRRTSSKRKRDKDQPMHNDKPKRRRSSNVLEEQTTSNVLEEPQREVIEEELENCIVVNTEAARPRPQSRRGRSAQQETPKRSARQISPALSRTSQKSAATTPSSQTSTGKRKRRGRRPKALQPSREVSPVTQVQVVQPTAMIEDVAMDLEATEAGAEQSLSEIPSLPSEVQETLEQARAVQASQKEIQPADVTPQLVTDDADVLEEEQEEEMRETSRVSFTSATVQTEIAATPSVSQATNVDYDLVKSLQTILTDMDNPSFILNNKTQDLATIHSLCFKIGLKASELAQQ